MSDITVTSEIETKNDVEEPENKKNIETEAEPEIKTAKRKYVKRKKVEPIIEPIIETIIEPIIPEIAEVPEPKNTSNNNKIKINREDDEVEISGEGRVFLKEL